MGGNHSHKSAVFDENEEGKRTRGAATACRVWASAASPFSLRAVPRPQARGLHPGSPCLSGPARRVAGSGTGTQSLRWGTEGRCGLRRRVRLGLGAGPGEAGSPAEPQAEGGLGACVHDACASCGAASVPPPASPPRTAEGNFLVVELRGSEEGVPLAAGWCGLSRRLLTPGLGVLAPRRARGSYLD